MMVHPGVEDLRQHAGEPGALSPRRARRIQRHLMECPRCRDLATWSESVVEETRAATEIRASAAAWDRVARRIRDGEAIVLPMAPEPPESGAGGEEVRERWWGRDFGGPVVARAAILVLVLAAAAAAVVPGSPVRSWLAGMGEPSRPGATPAASPAEAPPATARFVVPTDGGVVRVELNSPDPGLVLRVRTGPRGELTVQATGGAASARFGRGRARLAITEPGPGELLLVLPRGDGEVRVESDGRPVVWQEDGRLVVPAPVSDTVGSELLIRLGEVGDEESRR